MLLCVIGHMPCDVWSAEQRCYVMCFGLNSGAHVITCVSCCMCSVPRGGSPRKSMLASAMGHLRESLFGSQPAPSQVCSAWGALTIHWRDAISSQVLSTVLSPTGMQFTDQSLVRVNCALDLHTCAGTMCTLVTNPSAHPRRCLGLCSMAYSMAHSVSSPGAYLAGAADL